MALRIPCLAQSGPTIAADASKPRATSRELGRPATAEQDPPEIQARLVSGAVERGRTQSSMSVPPPPKFHEHGPFDESERTTITDVLAAIGATEGSSSLVENVHRNISLLDRLGTLLAEYPSLFETHALGSRKRDLSSLINMLSRSDLSNFEMFLPTRALIGRTLIMAEMNFYRLLRYACVEALGRERAQELLARVDGHLCRCIYTRLAGELLTNIASDSSTARSVREKAVMTLLHIWDGGTHGLGKYLSVLQATWDARQRVTVAGGSLVGTAEMFQLLGAGCDERFIDLLARPEATDCADEAAAFREFLFGTTTERLVDIEERMATGAYETTEDDDFDLLKRGAEGDEASLSDPALGLFEFFLSRHLQAAARRQGNLPGPKRTAEEYVMLHYLENQGAGPVGE